MKLNKKILLFLAFLFLVSLVALFLSKNAALDATLSIEAVPSDSKITINGQAGKHGLNKVRHGKLEITVSREGFSDRKQMITIEPKAEERLGFILVPKDPAFFDWYERHPEEQKKLEGISSRGFDAISSYITASNPLIQHLPYVDRTGAFRVDYGPSLKTPNEPKSIAVYIKARTELRRQLALDWIKSKGVDPAKLEIIYKDQ